jgi:hypothetical protein
MLKPEIPVTSIDPDGDLYLRIGQKRHGGARDFKVCSATMRRSSPVWKSMLFGPWTEAKPTQGDWIVELPEDSAEVLKILLSIVHGRFEVVPKNIALTLLYDMLIVTDKYDMISVIRPWANDWVRSVKDPAPIFLTGHEQLKRTYAAWELGCDGVVDEQMICFIFGLACHDRSFSYKGIPIFLLGCHNGPPDLVGKSNYLPSKSAYNYLNNPYSRFVDRSRNKSPHLTHPNHPRLLPRTSCMPDPEQFRLLIAHWLLCKRWLGVRLCHTRRHLAAFREREARFPPQTGRPVSTKCKRPTALSLSHVQKPPLPSRSQQLWPGQQVHRVREEDEG